MTVMEYIDVPERTLVQRMDALARANHVRVRKAELKREVKAGRVGAVDVLLDPPEFMETAKVIELLLSMPRVGRVKANKVLARCRVSPSKSLGGLTVRQRVELAAWLR